MSIEELERNVYKNLERQDIRSETFPLLDGLGEIIDSTLRNSHFSLRPQARAFAWSALQGQYQDTLVIGTATSAASNRSDRSSSSLYRNLLIPTNPDEYVDLANLVDKVDLATDSVMAVNQQLYEHEGYVPSAMLGWTVALIGLLDEQDDDRLLGSIRGLRFSDRHTDSEEMGDPHPVSTIILSESTPEHIGARLLAIAERDAATTTYKPHVWTKRLTALYEQLSNSKTNQLRHLAREKLGLPTDDTAFESFIECEQQGLQKAKVETDEVKAQQSEIILRIVTSQILDYTINY